MFLQSVLVLKQSNWRRCVLFLLLCLRTCYAGSTDFNFQCLQPQNIQVENYSTKDDIIDFKIGILVTERVTHQIMSRIFGIFLKDVLKYDRVDLLPIYDSHDNFNINETMLTIYYDKWGSTHRMLNLEVWVPPTSESKTWRMAEGGASIMAGRFGWFVPSTLITNANDSLYSLQSDIFRDTTNVYYNHYVLGDELLRNWKQQPAVDEYVNPLCEKRVCATLIAEYRHDTEFVITHITATKSFLNIIWLGRFFREKVLELYEIYSNDKTKHGKRFVVLHWKPSELINAAVAFEQMYMPRCEDLSIRNCKYELTPLVKYYDHLFTEYKDVEYVLEKFYMNNSELTKIYSDLMTTRRLLGANSSVDIYNHVACNWLKNSTRTIYSDWKRQNKATIAIGGIFPLDFTSRGHWNLENIATAASYAINRNSSILKNYIVKVKHRNGNCMADKVMAAFIYYFKSDDMLGVVGPACSETVEPIAGVSGLINLPTISYGAEGVSFANRQTYPYTFRTIGSNRQYEQLYISLMKAWGWRRIAALTEDGQKYTEYLSHMESKLKQNKLEMVVNKKFLSGGVPAAEMKKQLLDLKSRKAKIIIVDVHDQSAALAMCQAHKLGMTAKSGYVWFLPMWLSNSLDEWHQRVKDNCSLAELKEAIEGHFSIRQRPFGEPDALMQENITIREWLRMQNGNVSDFAGYAYDAVWVYALAAEKLLRENPVALRDLRWRNVTDTLTKYIWETDFHGLSGHVRFGEGGSRILPLEIMQWRRTEYIAVGHFEPNITGKGVNMRADSGKLKLNNTAIQWATGKQPDDGRYDCTFAMVARLLDMDCESSQVLFITAMCMLVVLIISAISFLFWKRRYDHKLRRSAKIMKNFGIDLHSPSRNDANTLDKWEVPKCNVVVNRRLGEGAFGTVFGGEAQIGGEDWLAVAVKTLKAGGSMEDRLDFLSEAEAMKRFDHKNIVKLLGVCLQSEPIYTIMEFMLYGDLKTYLLARRNSINEKSADESDTSPTRLTMYAMDVARGLAYLAERKYVHRDLACRNCLVNSQRVVKIGDFGMARLIHETDYYRYNRKGMMPVRWMSPESLNTGKFTTASDIWSFGVVIYEIITFGSYPYQGMTNNQVLEYVKLGNTLQIPNGAKPHLEALLRSCWNQNPMNRLTAREIIDYISGMPQLLTPCLDAPGAAVEMPETESDQLELLPKLRMCGTPAKRPVVLTILDTTNSTTILDDDFMQDISNCKPSNDTPDVTPKNPEINSAVTPDGYSIMSPLLIHSSKSDSSRLTDAIII